MDLKLLDILLAGDEQDDYGYKLFCEWAKDGFDDKAIILKLLSIEDFTKKRKSLSKLAWFISVESSGQHTYNKNPNFLVTEYAMIFKKYMYRFDEFDGVVPYLEWEDLAKESIDLLNILVKENKLEGYLYDSRYEKLSDKFIKRCDHFIKSGYHDLFEYQ